MFHSLKDRKKAAAWKAKRAATAARSNASPCTTLHELLAAGTVSEATFRALWPATVSAQSAVPTARHATSGSVKWSAAEKQLLAKLLMGAGPQPWGVASAFWKSAAAQCTAVSSNKRKPLSAYIQARREGFIA